jgi:hypothetical protein
MFTQVGQFHVLLEYYILYRRKKERKKERKQATLLKPRVGGGVDYAPQRF